MKTLAHISDLHFGREDPALVEALVQTLADAKPDILVVSGDFTQRAKKRQFRAARAFLRRLGKAPQLLVPGNHDVSATNLFERAVRPLRRYKRYITPDLTPFYQDDVCAIAGVNTVRLLNTKDGRINAAQVATACKQLGTAPAESLRIVVTHHPMDLPQEDLKHAMVTRAPAAMKAFARAGVDLFLSGHLHGGLSLTSCTRYKIEGYSAIIAHAGTAVSTRTRNEPNGWNLIHLAKDAITIDLMDYTGKRFERSASVPYARAATGWVKA